MTTNIDYIDATVFPRITRKTIAPLDSTKFFRVNDAPGCDYCPHSSLSHHSHRIANVYPPIKPPDVPGPPEYTPHFIAPREPAHAMYGPKGRDDWLIDTKATPAPSRYHPKRAVSGMPKFTIGYKSRPEGKKFVPFAIGEFIVKLYSDIRIESARRYTLRHPELKEIVHELFEMVFDEKPTDPLGLLRAYFEDLKAQRTPTDPLATFFSLCDGI
jgi:hypothetical protein